MPTLTTPTYTDLGNTGPTGPQGPQGVKGDTGNPGARGVAGPSGPLGPIGITPIFDVSANQSAAGTQPIVTQTGTAENVDLLFTIPKGDKGDTGTIEASYYLTPGQPMFTLDPTDGDTFINGTLDVSGNGTFERNLTINGILRAGTLEVGSSEIAITDPILQLGSNNIDDDLNRGISFKYFEDSSKTGFFGYDQVDNTFVFRPVASDDVTTGIFTGDYGTAKFGKVVVGNGIDSGIVESNGNENLVLQTGNTSTGTITIADGTNGAITIEPHGVGNINLSSAGTIELNCSTVRTGKANTNAALTTLGASNLTLHTNNGASSGNITIANGANGNISLTPNGSGSVVISKADINSGTFDGTSVTASTSIGVTNGPSLTTTGISNAEIIAGASTVTASGAVTGGSLTDGTATLSSGALSSATTVTASGAITGGSITDGTATLSGGNLSTVGTIGSGAITSTGLITGVGLTTTGAITATGQTIGSGAITSTGLITGVGLTTTGAITATGQTIGSGAITSTGLITGESALFGTSTAAAVSAGGVVTINNNNQSSNYTDGALIVNGGVGIAKDLNVNGTITGSFSGTVTGVSNKVKLTNETSDTTCFPTFSNTATGNHGLHTNSGLTYDSTTNKLTAQTFSGALNGNAATATTASQVALTTNNNDNTYYPIFATSASGNQALHTDITNSVTFTETDNYVEYNNHGLTAGQEIVFSSVSTPNQITVGISYYVLASGITTNKFKISTSAGGPVVDIAPDSTGTVSVVGASAFGLTYNPRTSTLTAGTFVGALTGLASSATTAAACTGNAATATSATSATIATNIAAGSANQIPYQTGTGATGFNSGLTFNGSDTLTVTNLTGNAATATSATSATTATNIAAGSANQIPYQTGTGATGFNSGLTFNGSDTLTVTNLTGNAATATTADRIQFETPNGTTVGVAGEIRYDSGHIYICISATPGNWVKATLHSL